jgi:hypothetical protein
MRITELPLGQLQNLEIIETNENEETGEITYVCKGPKFHEIKPEETPIEEIKAREARRAAHRQMMKEGGEVMGGVHMTTDQSKIPKPPKLGG